MLKSPSHYINCETSISSRPVRVSGETYGSAVIFFTPKIGDRNIDITALTCEFVQIIDRGEWGKEEVSYSVEASSSSNRKYHEFSFENECDSYELKFIPPAGLKLGIIQVFFDPDSIIHHHLSNMGVSNPASSDPAALQAAIAATIPQMAQAIGTQSGAAVQQALANQAAAEESKNSNTVPFTVKAWTGDIKNHLVLAANPVRMGVHLMHPGKNFSSTNTSDVFIAVGLPAGRDVNKWDYVMNALGDYNNDPDRETLPVYAWSAVGKPDTVITVTEYLP